MKILISDVPRARCIADTGNGTTGFMDDSG